MKSKVYLLIVLMVLLGCKQKQSTEEKLQPAIKVKVTEVKKSDGLFSLHYSGTVEASQTIPLSFQSSGTVERVFIQEGDFVKKGQLLATVEKSDNQSIYNSALAMYQQARDGYNRLKAIHDNGSLPEIKLVEMETNLKKAESQLEIAKNNLEKCNLYAPTDAVVGKRAVEPGQSALTSLSPIELVKIETILVKISVPENEIDKIRKGMEAGFTVPAIGDKSYKGLISHVGVVANQLSRTYEAKITVRNPNREIKPGMVCEVTLDPENGKKAILIPFQAVTKDMEGRPFVFVVSPDQKSVRKQMITVGNYQTQGLEVLSGLTINQRIVVEGKEKLFDNSSIIL